MRTRRAAPEFSLSFLDVICCGFGAVILLLMITKVVQPQVLEAATTQADSLVEELRKQDKEIRGETKDLNRELRAKKEQLSEIEARVAILQGDLNATRAAYDDMSTTNGPLVEQLSIRKQKLSEEQKRLERLDSQWANQLVAGIPVDSEYIILVIDTSPSMRQAWPRVLNEVESILTIYPQLKGIQALDADGKILVRGARGTWMPDEPSTRADILRALRTATSSGSSPVPGIKKAIETFYNPDFKISIYYLGDDYIAEAGPGFLSRTPSAAINRALKEIDKLNVADEQGNRKVAIHAIGFPVLWQTDLAKYSEFVRSRQRFATLMRLITARNGGTFVGIDAIEQ
jgi:hypothetical protein